MIHPAQKCAKGEPPQSIYTAKVLTKKSTNQNRQEKITNEDPYKGLDFATSRNNCN